MKEKVHDFNCTCPGVVRTFLVQAFRDRRAYDEIETIIHQNPGILETTDELGWTPLHDAINCRPPLPFDVIHLLVQKGPKAISMVTKSKMTPLHVACWSNVPFETIQLLVEHAPTPVQTLTEWGESPLHFACLHQRKDKRQVHQYLALQWPVACLLLLDEKIARLSSMKILCAYDRRKRRLEDALQSLSTANILSDAADAVIEVMLHFKVSVHHHELTRSTSKQLATTSSIPLIRHSTEVQGGSSSYRRLFVNYQAVESFLRENHLQCIIKELSLQPLVDGFFHMNRAGRNYLKCDPGNRSVGVSVLEAVRNNVDCLFVHLRENPTLIASSSTNL